MAEEKNANKVEDLTEFDDQIKLYPFNGRSNLLALPISLLLNSLNNTWIPKIIEINGLIDKFYIIGYDYLTLYKLLIEDTPKIIEEDNERETKEPHKFNLDEEPYTVCD